MRALRRPIVGQVVQGDGEAFHPVCVEPKPNLGKDELRVELKYPDPTWTVNRYAAARVVCHKVVRARIEAKARLQL